MRDSNEEVNRNVGQLFTLLHTNITTSFSGNNREDEIELKNNDDMLCIHEYKQ